MHQSRCYRFIIHPLVLYRQKSALDSVEVPVHVNMQYQSLWKQLKRHKPQVPDCDKTHFILISE